MFEDVREDSLTRLVLTFLGESSQCRSIAGERELRFTVRKMILLHDQLLADQRTCLCNGFPLDLERASGALQPRADSDLCFALVEMPVPSRRGLTKKPRMRYAWSDALIRGRGRGGVTTRAGV